MLGVSCAIGMIVLALTGSAAGQSTSAAKRPSLPTVAEAAEIQTPQTVVTYPRLVAMVHYGTGTCAADDAAASFDAALESFGFATGTTLDDRHNHVGFTMRLDTSYRTRIALHGVIGGLGSEEIDNYFHLGLRLTWAITAESSRAACLEAGTGVGISQIEVVKDYSDDRLSVGGDTYLDDIRYRTAWKPVLPLLVRIELPNLRHSRSAFVLTASYHVGSIDTSDLYTDTRQSQTVPLEMGLGGLFISVGIAAGY
jgi:hypothetical protein